jgi:hypothetical protein
MMTAMMMMMRTTTTMIRAVLRTPRGSPHEDLQDLDVDHEQLEAMPVM